VDESRARVVTERRIPAWPGPGEDPASYQAFAGVGNSTIVSLLVFGADEHEVAAARDRLTLALSEYQNWHQL
jgi:hypothetical protein